MVHAAIHDAVNAIERRSRPYAYETEANATASVDAAVAAAARDTLVSVLGTLPESPECRAAGIAFVDASYTVALAAVPDGFAKTDGVANGQAAAAAIIAQRAGDGSDTPLLDFDFPFPIAFAPGWGQVAPFVLVDSMQFRPRPSYHVTSAVSATRTAILTRPETRTGRHSNPPTRYPTTIPHTQSRVAWLLKS